MKLTLRVLGIPIISLDFSQEFAGEEYISNLGGSFDFAPEEGEDEEYEEDRGFGFGVT